MRSYTPEFRESAVAMVVSQGISVRTAADRIGMPFHTIDDWVRKSRGTRVAAEPPPATSARFNAFARRPKRRETAAQVVTSARFVRGGSVEIHARVSITPYRSHARAYKA